MRVSAVLGRMADGEWPGRLSRSRVDVLHLDQAEAQRSRLRKRTDGGAEVIVSLERGTVLRDGDVLGWDERRQAALIVRVEFGDVLIIDLGALLGKPAEILMARCVEVGHALGNQHWPAVVRGRQVYVPLTVAREVMAAVLKTHGFEGVSYCFAPGAEVLPYLSPHDGGLLLSGAGGHRHKAGPGAVGEEAG